MKKRIGILTWHYYANYGSCLQAYALQRTISGLGCDVKIIDYRNMKYGKVSVFKTRLKRLISTFTGSLIVAKAPFISFWNERFHLTKLIQKEDEIFDVCKKMDTVVCGSDQIWAPSVFNPVYMLENVPDHVRKISYAASIGLNEIPDTHTEVYKKLLGRFSAISVREEKGRELLRDRCDVDAEVVLDPTLLVDAQEWRKLKKKCELDSKSYVFCYFLNAENKYAEKVQQFARERGLSIVGISANPNDKWISSPEAVGPREFLWLIDNAQYVITDSYHGSIFSLLFHKKVKILERFKKDDVICQNSRINQLQEWFDLTDVVTSIEDFEPRCDIEIDSLAFEGRLAIARKHSIEYLKNALGM